MNARRFCAISSSCLLSLTAYAQSNTTNIGITIQDASAVRGFAIAPDRDTHHYGFTVFCSVVVDNKTGNDLTYDRRSRPKNPDNIRSVFDTLHLCVCDDTGKTLSSNPYMWRKSSTLPRYVTLLQGRSTNSLYYFIPFSPPTNGHVSVRIEGRLGAFTNFNAGLTSNIVKANLY